jgi:hypothetical protein
VTGVCGAVSAWIGTESGAVGLAISLVLLFSIAGALIGRSDRAKAATVALTDDELVDVLRSAVLDIPASRLPD